MRMMLSGLPHQVSLLVNNQQQQQALAAIAIANRLRSCVDIGTQVLLCWGMVRNGSSRLEERSCLSHRCGLIGGAVMRCNMAQVGQLLLAALGSSICTCAVTYAWVTQPLP